MKRSNKPERPTMKTVMRVSAPLAVMLPVLCFAGEVVYQDYLAESELLSAHDREANAWILTLFDWNYFFESNRLALAMKIKYEKDETNIVVRPIVARYEFNGVHEPVGKSIRRADTCYGSYIPTGFCMIGLDSFLFAHDQRPFPKASFMCIADSTQKVEDITRELNGMTLRGALSDFERAVFPDGEGWAFQCVAGKANNWGLLLWNKEGCSLWSVPSCLKGYTCLSGGRVLIDELDTSNVRTKCGLHASRNHEKDPLDSESHECWKMNARCYQVLPCCDSNATHNAYADWDCALSNKIISLGKDVLGRYDWSIELHGMEKMYSDSELGHEFVEGDGVLYDFFKWRIFRIRKSDSDWQVFDLKDLFSADIRQAQDYVPMSILQRGVDSCYYALLFECKKQSCDDKPWYRIRVVEIPYKGEKAFLWSFPDFSTTKKLTTFPCRSPGVVHKLQDDSWVFISSTCTFTNDAIFVQRMTGSKEAIRSVFR